MKHLFLLVLIWVLILAACTVTKTVHTTNPFRGGQVGCGNFIVYKLSEDNTQLVSVAMNMTDIEVKPSQSYGIDKTEVIEVKWKTYDGDISTSLCNDASGKKAKIVRDLVARSGLVELIIGEGETEKMKRNEPYAVSLVLKKVTFDGETIDYLKIEGVKVGWLPG